MSTLPTYLSADGPSTWKLQVWVQPGAKRDEPAGEYQGCLKLRIAAPAVDNKANKAVVKYAAKLLGLKPSQVTLDAGHANRRKTLRIQSDVQPVPAAAAGN